MKYTLTMHMYMYVTEISASTHVHVRILPPSAHGLHTLHVYIIHVLTTVGSGVLHKPLNTFQLIRPTAQSCTLQSMCIQRVHTDYK